MDDLSRALALPWHHFRSRTARDAEATGRPCPKTTLNAETARNFKPFSAYSFLNLPTTSEREPCAFEHTVYWPADSVQRHFGDQRADWA